MASIISGQLKKLWDGDAPLSRVFWLYYVVAGILFIFLEASTRYSNIYYIVVVLKFVYLSFMSGVVWRSANIHKETYKYKWAESAASIAKVTVIIVCISMAGSLVNTGNVVRENKINLVGLVKKMNADLPRNVNKTVRLDRVDVSGDRLEYRYTVLLQGSEIDKTKFEQYTTSQIREACKRKEVLALFNQNVSVIYYYNTIDNQPFLSANLSRASCDK